MNTLLCIDAQERADETVILTLRTPDATLATTTVPFQSGESQHLVPEIAALLKAHAPEGIDGVALIQGAERFTIARLTSVITNALGFGLNVPVVAYTDWPSDEELFTPQENTAIQAHYTSDPRIDAS